MFQAWDNHAHYDYATDSSSNYLDSEAIEAGLSRHQKRGRARDDRGQWEMKTPTLATMLRFLKAAGVEKIEVFDPFNPKLNGHYVGDVLPVKNQADILYYSGHGIGATGGLLSCWDKHPVLVSDIAPSVNWKEDLDYFIIAGCAVLKPDGTNGFAWGNATLKQGILKGLCGYYERAPADNEKDEATQTYIPNSRGPAVRIAERFTQLMTAELPKDYGTGHRILNAWLQANKETHSLGIVYNRDYYWMVVEQLNFYRVLGPYPWP